MPTQWTKFIDSGKQNLNQNQKVLRKLKMVGLSKVYLYSKLTKVAGIVSCWYFECYCFGFKGTTFHISQF